MNVNVELLDKAIEDSGLTVLIIALLTQGVIEGIHETREYLAQQAIAHDENTRNAEGRAGET